MTGLLLYAIGAVFVLVAGIANDRQMYGWDPDTVWWFAMTWPLAVPCLVLAMAVEWWARERPVH